MSYDISLVHPVTREVLTVEHPHEITGGTYALGGTRNLWLNVTYNYAPHFYRTIDPEKGIRAIYGLTGEESIPLFNASLEQLADDYDQDYWAPTEGNAKAALLGLREFARLRPDGVWEGD